MGRESCKSGTARHPQNDVPPLKALKLWCLKKCSKNTPIPPCHGLKAATPDTKDSQTPAWMREGNLDERVWKELPDDLLEHALAFLPFADLFRFRTVCKQWQAITQSPQFRRTRAESSPVSWPSFCPVRYNDKASESGEFRWSGYSPATNKWHEMPPLALPCLAGKNVWASAGGLLCFYSRASAGHLVVCNPATWQWRALPPTSHKWKWPCVTHMVVDGASKEYRIILAGARPGSSAAGPSRATEVYSSASDRWEVTGSLPADLHLDTQDAALANGLLYCTAQKAPAASDMRDPAGDALVAYDVAHGTWAEVAPDLPYVVGCPAPLVCGGRVLLVFAPMDEDAPVGRVYALDAATRGWEPLTYAATRGWEPLTYAATRGWEPLTSMPEAMHKKLGFWGVCVSRGNHIIIVGETSELVVTYDVVQNTWRESPGNKTMPGFHFFSPISFQPDVNAIP